MSIYDYSRGAQARNQQRNRGTGPPTPPPFDPSRFERHRQAKLNQPTARRQQGGPTGPGLLGRAFRSAMSRLGPAGQIINAALDVTQGYDLGQSIEDLIDDLHEAKRENPRAQATYDSLLAAAQEVLDEATKRAPPLRDYQPPPSRGGGMSPPVGPGQPGGPPPGGPAPPPGTPGAPSQGAGSQLIPTELEPRMSPPGAPPRPGEQVEWSEEIQVQSSNVWSFRYHFPSSTLAITYKAPRLNPGVKNRRGSIQGIRGASIKGKLDQPGPIYYYSGVPVRVFRLLTGASSAGKAVWTHVRVRGSKWAHQYPYRLAQGSIQPGEGGRLGVWVPRRATRRGYRYRTLPQAGQGRRGYIESSLPQQLTAQPDRGEPDRGTPDRGTFF